MFARQNLTEMSFENSNPRRDSDFLWKIRKGFYNCDKIQPNSLKHAPKAGGWAS